jgi:exodeoxyribonuclease VII small subunit
MSTDQTRADEETRVGGGSQAGEETRVGGGSQAGDGTRAGKRTYEVSVTRVEEIIRRLDAGEATLGETLQLVREGRDLIEHCAGELEAVGGALEELRLEDLVARLEGDAGGVRAR